MEHQPKAQTRIRIFGFHYIRGRKTPLAYFWLLAVRDCLLAMLWGRTTQTPAPQMAEPKIVVSKIDHLGDVLMITPFLLELKRQLPKAKIILIIGSWSKVLAEMLHKAAICDLICHYDAPAMNRAKVSLPKKCIRFLKTFLAARSLLRREKPDVFMDLRPYSPNTLLLARICRIPFRVGFGLRGLAFTLHQEIHFDAGVPLGQLFLDALSLLGLKRAEYERPLLPPADPSPADDAAMRAECSGPYVVLQPCSGESSREIAHEIWDRILDVLCPRIKVIMLGGPGDASMATRLGQNRTREQFKSMAGRTTLPQAVRIAEKSKGCIGVDSFFAHVGLAYALPVIVLAVKTSLRMSFPRENPNLHYVEVEKPGFSPEEIARAFLDRVLTSDVRKTGPAFSPDYQDLA